MAPLSPEASHGLPDRIVATLGVGVDVTSVVELGDGVAVDEVDFRVREGLEVGHAEFFG